METGAITEARDNVAALILNEAKEQYDLRIVSEKRLSEAETIKDEQRTELLSLRAENESLGRQNRSYKTMLENQDKDVK